MVTQNSKPRVLVIDDDNMEAFVRLLELRGLDALHVTPDELEDVHLDNVQVVLVDEYLDKWNRRESVSDSVGLYVRDGIALSAVLRSHFDGRGSADNGRLPLKDTSIVLRTGQLDHLAAGTPRYMQPVTIARQHDLEWVVRKEDDGDRGFDAIRALACAVLSLPRQWDGIQTVGLDTWLGLREQSWREAAMAQIEECRPPWSVLAASSAGRKWISWFLQRILPFPTFLIDDLRAAAYLGLSGSALDVLLEDEGIVGRMLADSEYVGQLTDFTGRRWWRAGLQNLKREMLASARDGGADSIFMAVNESSGLDLGSYRLGLDYPVFQIDNDYNVLDKPIEVTMGVRLQPDEWPSYADDPWLDSSLLPDSELAQLVLVEERL